MKGVASPDRKGSGEILVGYLRAGRYIARACLALASLLIVMGAAGNTERFPLGGRRVLEARADPEWAREALPAYLGMGAEFEQRGEFDEAFQAYRNAGMVAAVLGRPQVRLDAAQKAMEMAERTSKPAYLDVASRMLGFAYLALNAPRKAIPLLEQALAYSKQYPDSLESAARTLVLLGQAHRQVGERQVAVEYQKQAVQNLQTLIQLANQDVNRRQNRRGTDRQHVIADTRERFYQIALVELGETLIVLRQWDEARGVLQTAVDVAKQFNDPDRIAAAERSLGEVAFPTGDYPTALRWFSEAASLANTPGTLFSIQRNLGATYLRLGRPQEAEPILRQAIKQLEDQRSQLDAEGDRESFLENKIVIYDNLVLALFNQNKAVQAFDVNERARSRAFLDLLGNRVRLSRGADPSLVREERALQERIAALKAASEFDDSPATRQELDATRDAYQAFLQRVRQTDQEHASLLSVEPLTIRQVQALLPEHAVLLEYFVINGNTFVWSVERDRIAARRLGIDRQTLRREVQAFRELITSRGDEAEVTRQAQALFDQLVRPVLQERRPQDLLIVPHDVLHYLPFQALKPAADRFLEQDVPIRYVSSASLLQFTRAKAQTNERRILALGNPDLHDPSLNLRYAEREVRAIADLFPNTTLLIRETATKDQALSQSPKYTVLHFATHAELDEADPLGSALRLTSTPKDNGRLEVEEIFGLDLHASLIVLSACETSLGKLTLGDELTGLTRAFIYAGTPSVITTLWQVNDRASYELMQEFYHQLQTGKDKAEALRSAEVTTLAKYPHPYFWAAYQLTGEAR